eukprot:TRINITY_DN10150_c0_g1_i6.p2 TRINITY_DN10150_c0_g1~~TRINITY_DN10150_c0_g1_i6.p2  ORF type:complete len:179 (+),score=13.90 TRINITY_DN10150_c0_g1_i6:757-1293(+)
MAVWGIVLKRGGKGQDVFKPKHSTQLSCQGLFSADIQSSLCMKWQCDHVERRGQLNGTVQFGQTPLALAVEHDEDRYQETVLKMIQAGAEAIMMYQTRWVRNRTLAQVHRAWMLEHLWSLADDLWRLELAETDRCERTPIAVAVCLLVRNVSEEDTLKAAWWKCIVKWSYQSLLDVRA